MLMRQDQVIAALSGLGRAMFCLDFLVTNGDTEKCNLDLESEFARFKKLFDGQISFKDMRKFAISVLRDRLEKLEAAQ